MCSNETPRTPDDKAKAPEAKDAKDAKDASFILTTLSGSSLLMLGRLRVHQKSNPSPRDRRPASPRNPRSRHGLRRKTRRSNWNEVMPKRSPHSKYYRRIGEIHGVPMAEAIITLV